MTWIFEPLEQMKYRNINRFECCIINNIYEISDIPDKISTNLTYFLIKGEFNGCTSNHYILAENIGIYFEKIIK